MDLRMIALGEAIGVAAFAFLSLYPFYVQRYKPARYRGAWKSIGDVYQTPVQAVLTSIAMAVGAVLVTMVFLENGSTVVRALLDVLFPLVLFFFGIVFGVRLLELSRRVEELEDRLTEFEERQRGE